MRAGETFSYRYIRPPEESVYQGVLRVARDDVLVFDSPLSPSTPLRIDGEIVLGDGYLATWFLYRGQPWDVARVYRPDGALTGYYADITEPIEWQNDDPSTLTIVDLFLDLWVTPTGRYQPLDEDELDEAERAGRVTPGQGNGARAVLRDLISVVEQGRFPPRDVRV